MVATNSWINRFDATIPGSTAAVQQFSDDARKTGLPLGQLPACFLLSFGNDVP